MQAKMHQPVLCFAKNKEKNKELDWSNVSRLREEESVPGHRELGEAHKCSITAKTCQ
jgi:hypothetical protein